MSCCHNYYVATEGGENAFAVDISAISCIPRQTPSIGFLQILKTE